MIEVLSVIAFLLSAGAAIASFFANRKSNSTAEAVKNFQINSVLNQREIELIGQALERLNIYNVWCKQGASGQAINYHDSCENEYATRDEAWIRIPQDVKFILIQLCAHSEKLESLINCWEDGFMIKVGSSYRFEDNLVSEKIRSLRAVIYDGLL